MKARRCRSSWNGLRPCSLPEKHTERHVHEGPSGWRFTWDRR